MFLQSIIVGFRPSCSFIMISTSWSLKLVVCSLECMVTIEGHRPFVSTERLKGAGKGGINLVQCKIHRFSWAFSSKDSAGVQWQTPIYPTLHTDALCWDSLYSALLYCTVHYCTVMHCTVMNWWILYTVQYITFNLKWCITQWYTVQRWNLHWSTVIN